MDIHSIRLKKLHNEAHYEFFFVFNSLLNRFPAVKSLVNLLYASFTQSLDREKQLVDAGQKSLLTEKLAEVDKRIDRYVTGIRYVIRGYANHFDDATAEAAKLLYTRLKDYGDIYNKPYEEASAAVQLLISDLQTTYAAQVQTLHLAPWVAKLAEEEAAFLSLYLQRNAEKAARPQKKMLQARKELETVYLNMTVIIRNSLVTTGEATCGQFVLELNNAMKYAAEHAYRRTMTDISNATVASIPDQLFTGRQVIVIPEVCYKDTPLVLATDFTVVYADNVRIGNAGLTIRGKGAFSGSKTVTFNIVAPTSEEQQPAT